MNSKYLHTAPCFSKKILEVESPSQANGNSMTLKNVRIVEEGEALGHGVFIDKSFIKDVVSLAQGRRIKCRFGHPGMCQEALGTYLGYYTNFQVVSDAGGDYAVADLHLSKAATKSPNGNLAEYIRDLAKEAPEFFGNSIVFSASGEYYKTSEGINVYPKPLKNEEGDTENSYVTQDGEAYNKEKHGVIDFDKVYEGITALHGGDLVDEPAATSSLFGEPSLLEKVAEVFGLSFGGLRKTATLKKLITEFSQLNSMKQLSINATTADGIAIVVETDNAYIGIGDKVTDSEGNPVADGQHVITESDSGQTGITITTTGGVITRIEPTGTESSQEQPQNSSEGVQAELSALLSKVRALTSNVNELKAKLDDMAKKGIITNEQFDSIGKRVELLEKEPADEKTVVTKPSGYNKPQGKFGWTL
jgi:hypothetical protein